LLSNIMLHELDKEMEKRKLKYVRYADDFSIYAKWIFSPKCTTHSYAKCTTHSHSNPATDKLIY